MMTKTGSEPVLASMTDEIPHRDRDVRTQITPAQQFSQDLQKFISQVLRVCLATSVLTPLLIAGFLTLDMPVRFLNGLFSIFQGLRPSAWLTWGQIVMAFVPLIALLFTRKFGGQEASRAIMISWVILALFILFELSVLADVIEDGDFPSARYAMAFVGSAMTGQLVAVAFYDVARGGGAWWRAPFYAAMLGFVVTALIYFPAAYWNTNQPWAIWLVGDLMIRLVLATLFLPVYSFLRPYLIPRAGYGGR